jgi:hypothetical protein
VQANETARPWGHRGPTPAQAWARRRPLSHAERTAFTTTVQKMDQDERAAQGLGAEAVLGRSEPAVLRAALARALVAAGHLTFTSQVVAPSL